MPMPPQENALISPKPTAAAPGVSPVSGLLPPAALRALLRDIGTNLWRMTRKMVPEGSTEPIEEMAPAYRYVESMWEAFREAGIQVQDHTGEPFDSGMPLVSLAFQPTAGLKRETILETIKPSIYLGQERIQTGEVIVGSPIEPITPEHPAVAVAAANGVAAPEILHPVETESPPAANTTAVVSETTQPEDPSFDLGSEPPVPDVPDVPAAPPVEAASAAAPDPEAPSQEPAVPASTPAAEGERNA
jgi:hypothetical protein